MVRPYLMAVHVRNGMGYDAIVINRMPIISCRRSQWLALFGGALSLVAVVAVLVSGLQWPYRLVLLGLIVIAQLRANRHDESVTLYCRSDGYLGIDRDSNMAIVSTETLVWPWLIVLRWRPLDESAMKTRIFLPDSMDEHDFRQFRLWLRWRQQPDAVESVV